MNIVVTGAGLIGCYFAQQMTAQGHRVVIADVAPNEGYVRSIAGDVPLVRLDIRDLPALAETFQQHQAEAIFHSAGLIAGKVADRIYSGLEINVWGTVNAVEAARLAGVRRFVFASTLGVYDLNVPATGPIREDFPTGVDQAYGSSKVAGEQILRAYATRYPIQLVMLRFATVYGRGHFAGGSVPGLAMNEIMLAAANGGPVTVNRHRVGQGEFVYVRDAARAVGLACTQDVKSKVFNVTPGTLVTGDALAAAIRAARPKIDVRVIDEQVGPPGLVRPQPMDPSRARDELGFVAEYDLDRGVADYLAEIDRTR